MLAVSAFVVVAVLIVLVAVWMIVRRAGGGNAAAVVGSQSRADLSTAGAKSPDVLWSATSGSGDFRITARRLGEHVVLECSGTILLSEGELVLRDAANRLVQEGHRTVALNLAQVRSIDSAGIGELVRTYTLFSRQGGQLVLVRPTESVSDMLSITRLSGVLPVVTSEAEATDAFSRAR